jgi:endonuclease YncB( thermonuclease family)
MVVVGLAVCASSAQADPCEGALPAAGVSFTGVVRYVGDGDGLCVSDSSDRKQWIEVRLADFYAPELHARGGQAAKRALTYIALGRRVRCAAGKRSYDRVVARCWLGSTSIGDLMRSARVPEGGNGR